MDATNDGIDGMDGMDDAMDDEPGAAPEPAHSDLSREDLLALDVPALLAGGFADSGGGMRGEVAGTAAAAAAEQLAADGLPLPMLGRMLTMVNRHTRAAAVADLDVIVEEPDRRGFPRAAAIVRAGVGACRDDADWVLFDRWLADVHGLLALRDATA